jgi:hypothetical protein
MVIDSPFLRFNVRQPISLPVLLTGLSMTTVFENGQRRWFRRLRQSGTPSPLAGCGHNGRAPSSLEYVCLDCSSRKDADEHDTEQGEQLRHEPPHSLAR